MKINIRTLIIGLLGIALLISGCGGGGNGSPGGGISVAIDPAAVTLPPNGVQQFEATVSGTSNQNVTWTVSPEATGGIVNSSGAYTAPAIPGEYHVIATSVADPTKTATATVNVVTGTVQRKYTGTITITKSGIADGRDHYDESAELTELKIMEGAGGSWKAVRDLYVDAEVNDSIGDIPQVTITFGPQKFHATTTDVVLYINEAANTYLLTINCIIPNAILTDPEAGSFPQIWPIAIMPIENIALPADASHLTGTVTQNIDDGVTATITWDLTRNI